MTDDTLGLAVYGLSRSTDPRAEHALDNLLDQAKTRPETMQTLIAPLCISETGREAMRRLTKDPAIDEKGRSLMKLAGELAEAARASSHSGEDDDE